jgi:hypothetical protein
MHRALFMRLVVGAAVCGASVLILVASLSASVASTNNPQLPRGRTGAAEPAQPDYYYYYLDRDSGTLSPLELQVSKARAWSRDLGLGGVRGGYGLANGQSSFRIKSGKPQEFLIRFAPAFGGIREDVRSIKAYVFLSPVSSKKSRREVVTVQWPFIGRPRINEDKIPCDVKAYGDGSMLVTPHAALPAGEYAFVFSDPYYSSRGETAVFAFGVDPPTAN